MNDKVKKIIYIAVLVITIIGAILVFTSEGSKKKIEEIISEVVVLEEAKVLPENEGKLVLISGKLTGNDTNVKDEDFNIEVNTPYLKRDVEIYELKSVLSGKYNFEWKKTGSVGPQQLDNKDEEDTNTYWNTKQHIEDKEYFGDANLGDFVISSDRVKALGTNARYTNFTDEDVSNITFAKQIFMIDGVYDRYNRDSLVAKKIDNKSFIKEIATQEQFDKGLGFINQITVLNKKYIENAVFHKDGEYISSVERIPVRGDIRVAFDYLDVDKKGEISILAKQVGNELQPYELDTADPIYQIYDEKITDTKALAQKLEADANDAKIGVCIFLGILLVVGIFVFRKKETK